MWRKHKKLIVLLLVLLIPAAIIWAASTSINYGSHTSMTITSLNSLASSQTAGWQSAGIDNTSTAATDYMISVKLSMQSGTAANDKAVYIYVCPAYYDGSSWYYSDGGTTTLPSGSEGTYTIGLPNDLTLVAVLSDNQSSSTTVLQKTFTIGAALGYVIPDGFSIIIINYTGVAIASSGNMVAYKAIKTNIN